MTFFPDNSHTNFRVKLATPLSLDSYWYVALCEMNYKLKPADPSKSLLVECNLCKPSYVNNHTRPILRRVNRKGAGEFMNKEFFPVAHRYIETIGVYIRNNTGEEPLFANQGVELTLHLKRALSPNFL